MKRFKLTLTDEQGVVLNSWCLSTDKEDPKCDVLVPIQKFAIADLGHEVNYEIEKVLEKKDAKSL